MHKREEKYLFERILLMHADKNHIKTYQNPTLRYKGKRQHPSQIFADGFGSPSISALYDNEILSEIQLNNDDKSRESAEEVIDNIILINKTKPGFNASSPENLELSIRNSVKSQIETKQHLKPLSLLEVFKEISEPEIRTPLSADIVLSNNLKKDNNDDINFKQDTLLLLAKAYNETNFEKEAAANISDRLELNNKIAVVEVNAFDKINTHQPDIKQSSDITSEQKLTLANISVKLEQSKIIKLPAELENDSLKKKEYDTKVKTNTVQSQIKHFNKQNNYPLAGGDTQLSLNSRELLDNNFNDDILSVHLNEAIDADLDSSIENDTKSYFDEISEEIGNGNNTGEDTQLEHVVIKNNFNDDILSVHLNETIDADLDSSIENNTKSYFDEISEEIGNGNNTGEDKQLEHVVIKKVLGGQPIYDKSYVTTIDPSKHSDQNNETKKCNELIKSNELEIEYTTLCTFCLFKTEEISSTTKFLESTEYYQSTGTTEQFESNETTFDFAQTKHQEETNREVHSGSKKADFFVEGANQQDQVKIFDIGPEELTTQTSKGGHLKEAVEIYKKDPNFLKNNKSKEIISNVSKWDIPISTNYKQLDKYIHTNQATVKPGSSFNLEQIVQLEQNTDKKEIISKNSQSQETLLKTSDFIQQRQAEKYISNIRPFHNQNHTAASEKFENGYILDIMKNGKIKLSDMGNHVKNYRTVGKQEPFDDRAATLFEAYLPRDVGQTLNDNLADESTGIGKALPVSVNGGSNSSTIIIILGSGTVIIFIGISLTIILISFHRQHGTLDIEMQERSCGKDDLDEEDAQTFAKLLEVDLTPSLALALDESEECL